MTSPVPPLPRPFPPSPGFIPFPHPRVAHFLVPKPLPVDDVVPLAGPPLGPGPSDPTYAHLAEAPAPHRQPAPTGVISGHHHGSDPHHVPGGGGGTTQAVNSNLAPDFSVPLALLSLYLLPLDGPHPQATSAPTPCPLSSIMASFFLVTSCPPTFSVVSTFSHHIHLFSIFPHPHPHPHRLGLLLPLPPTASPLNPSPPSPPVLLPSLSSQTHSPTHCPPSQLGSCAYLFSLAPSTQPQCPQHCLRTPVAQATSWVRNLGSFPPPFPGFMNETGCKAH